MSNSAKCHPERTREGSRDRSNASFHPKILRGVPLRMTETAVDLVHGTHVDTITAFSGAFDVRFTDLTTRHSNARLHQRLRRGAGADRGQRASAAAGGRLSTGRADARRLREMGPGLGHDLLRAGVH